MPAQIKRKYELSVYCRHNGVSRDAGVHDSIETSASNEDVISILMKSAAELLFHYDTVACDIVVADPDDHRPLRERAIYSQTLRRPTGQDGRRAMGIHPFERRESCSK